MELSEIRLVVAIAGHGSLTRAAAARSTTQSALSRQLARIEHDWGGRLFDRTGRGLHLTEAGQRLLPELRALLDDADRLKSELRGGHSGLSGEVRIGMIPSTPEAITPALYRRLRASHPQLRISLFEGSGGQIEEWLTTGQVGIGIFFRHGAKPGGHNEEMLSTVDAFLVGPEGDPVTGNATVDFERLAGLPLVLARSPNSLRTRLEQMAARKGFALDVVIEANSVTLHGKLAAEGCGYAVLSSYAVSESFMGHRLSAARIVKPPVKRHLSLATTPHRPLSFAEREVAAEIRKVALEMLVP
ncbi:LysR family transcriptional regulator [Ramlibacter humi]|uniref:LysR family transcriptional regulator n=1 Tax=Ramlibacter humi TaxID=2530451 RepID=A0A4Z0BGC3_9BURK|nr:LysR family transcriptional regulator [Ramlibacter humi]TFY97184.1 LysR family transcriptional regulator [Ramlibacter humi]